MDKLKKKAIVSLIGDLYEAQEGGEDKAAAKEEGRLYLIHVHAWEALIGGLSFLNKVSTDTECTLKEGETFNLCRAQLSSSSNHQAERYPDLPQLGCLWT